MLHPLQELVIGSNRIPVRIFEGPGKRRRHISYDRRYLEVCIPEGDGVEGALAFLRERETRILEGWREVRERFGRIADPGDGLDDVPWKVLYWGKRRGIRTRQDGPIYPHFKGTFDVRRGDGDSIDCVRARIIRFLHDRLQDDLRVHVEKHAKRLSIRAGGFEIGDLGSHWGKVRTDGTLVFHWRLAHAPKGSIEYAVIHLLAHLQHHFHCDLFDAFLRKASEGLRLDTWWLDRNAWILDPSDGDRI